MKKKIIAVDKSEDGDCLIESTVDKKGVVHVEKVLYRPRRSQKNE